MALKLSMQFDGGTKEFNRVLDKGSETIKDLSLFFQKVVTYFENKDEKRKSPILTIYESSGGAIQSNWHNSTKYEEWKGKNWGIQRLYDLPITENKEQILSGRTLYSLLDSKSMDAVREITPKSMVFGTRTEQAAKWQGKKRILDFFPEMETEVSRVFRLFIHETIPEIDDTGDKK